MYFFPFGVEEAGAGCGWGLCRRVGLGVLVGLGGGEGESLSCCMGEEECPSAEEQAWPHISPGRRDTRSMCGQWEGPRGGFWALNPACAGLWSAIVPRCHFHHLINLAAHNTALLVLWERRGRPCGG